MADKVKEAIYKHVAIDRLSEWEDNPRAIKRDDYERLKRQILSLGVYKPLIVCKNEQMKGPGYYIVLGGNMRLVALRELKIKSVAVSIVEAPDEATRIKYALSDNDRAGEYIEDQVAELVFQHTEEINLDDFKIDIEEPVLLADIADQYAGGDSGGKDNFSDLTMSQEAKNQAENYVSFVFGDYRGLIHKDVYKEFAAICARMAQDKGAVSVEDAIKEWVNGSSK